MPLPRFWYLPRGTKAAVVVTGDDHAQSVGRPPRAPSAVRRATRTSTARRAARWPTGSACARRATCSRAPPSPTRRWRTSRPRASRSRCTCGARAPGRLDERRQPELQQRHARAPPRPEPPARPVHRRRGRAPRAGHEPQPLHRLERLGDVPQAELGAGHPLRHELLLLARRVGPGPPRPLHRVGLPAALRRHRRLAGRRLPGHHAAHRRVRAQTSPTRSPSCSTTRSARRATTRSSPPTCTPIPRPTTRDADAIIAAAQARGIPTCRPSRCSPGSTAATRRRSPACRLSGGQLQLRDQPTPAAPAGCRRCSRSTARPARLLGLARNGETVASACRTIKGIDYAMFDGGRRLVRGDLPGARGHAAGHHAVPPPGAARRARRRRSRRWRSSSARRWRRPSRA